MSTSCLSARERYKKERDKRGFTDTYVCQNTGVKQSTLSDWLSGESKTLGGDKAIALAKFFDVPLDSFVEPILVNKETLVT